MKEFLLVQAGKSDAAIEELRPLIKYSENIEEVYHRSWGLKGDLDVSWVWKIAVLALIDSNKWDWAEVYIGWQHDPKSEPVYLGRLSFHSGENMDIARTVKRILSAIQMADPGFDE